MDHSNTARHLIRMIGVMAIGVALAWAFQVLGLGGSTAFGKLLWIVGAAVVAGAGAGLIYGSASVPTAEPLQARVR